MAKEVTFDFGSNYKFVVLFEDSGSVIIRTNLHHPGGPTRAAKDSLLSPALDGLETLVKALAKSGFDIDTPQFRGAVQTAVDTIMANWQD